MNKLLILLLFLSCTTFVSASVVTANFSQPVQEISRLTMTNTHPWPLAFGCRVGNATSSGEEQNCTYEQQRAWFLEAGLDGARSDVDFGSTARIPIPSTAAFTMDRFTTFLQSNYGSAPLAKNGSDFLGSEDKVVWWDGQTTPDWNANITSWCTTGNKTCSSLNYTQTENIMYEWLKYTNATDYQVYVGSRNEPFAVNPPFFLKDLTFAGGRCNATNFPIVVGLIAAETRANWAAVDRYNTDYNASVRKTFPAPYTFENGSAQEKCEMNFTIAVTEELETEITNGDVIFSIHDYYNNLEVPPDATNSFDWMTQ